MIGNLFKMINVEGLLGFFGLLRRIWLVWVKISWFKVFNEIFVLLFFLKIKIELLFVYFVKLIFFLVWFYKVVIVL